MAIEIVNINKAYGSNKVLQNFSCRIEDGTTICVTGPSGCGKTTLLRIILGLEKPDSGFVAGVQHQKKSVVFQEDRLCDNLSAAANIRLVCRKPPDMKEVIAVMSAAGLEPDCAKQPVHSMSGGQRRRIAVIRALMADYDVLFMDEPFKGLDAETKNAVLQLTRERSRGKTVVLITHDKDECAALNCGGNVFFSPKKRNKRTLSGFAGF